jgi:hypothetical protein
VPRRASPAARESAARQAAIRTIAGGERPVYRVLPAQDGGWAVLGYPWLVIDAKDRKSALECARTAVVQWLNVGVDDFDVEAVDPFTSRIGR